MPHPLITKVVLFYPPHNGSNLLEKLLFGNNYWEYSINGRECKSNAVWKVKGITIEKQIFIIIQYNQPVTREMLHRKSFRNILGNSRRMSNLVYGIGGSQCQFKNFPVTWVEGHYFPTGSTEMILFNFQRRFLGNYDFVLICGAPSDSIPFMQCRPFSILTI